MDIFRVRRRLLGRKLWKCRCRGIPADVDKQAMCAVVKLLTYYQLKALDRAVKLRTYQFLTRVPFRCSLHPIESDANRSGLWCPGRLAVSASRLMLPKHLVHDPVDYFSPLNVLFLTG